MKHSPPFCYNASTGILLVLSHLVELSANKALATMFSYVCL